MGGHRAFGAGDDLVDGPVDLAAVRADDALLDAIAGGASLGGLGRSRGRLRPTRSGRRPSGRHPRRVEGRHRARPDARARVPRRGRRGRRGGSRGAGAAGRPGASPDAVRGRRGRHRRRARGLHGRRALGAARRRDVRADEGPLLPAGRQRPEGPGRPATRSTQANGAIRRGRRPTAQSLLQSAAGQIQAAQPEDQPALQQQREDALKSLAPTPPAESGQPVDGAPSASTSEGTTAQERSRQKRTTQPAPPAAVTPSPNPAPSPAAGDPPPPAPDGTPRNGAPDTTAPPAPPAASPTG